MAKSRRDAMRIHHQSLTPLLTFGVWQAPETAQYLTSPSTTPIAGAAGPSGRGTGRGGVGEGTAARGSIEGP